VSDSGAVLHFTLRARLPGVMGSRGDPLRIPADAGRMVTGDRGSALTAQFDQTHSHGRVHLTRASWVQNPGGDWLELDVWTDDMRAAEAIAEYGSAGWAVGYQAAGPSIVLREVTMLFRA
jgi:hypothetical protein